MKAYLLHKTGGSNAFKLEKVDDPKPKRGEVLVKHSAIGVNFFDVHFRRGDYQLNKMPAILGLEACGYVEAVGPDVKDYKIGERVAYATAGVGSYAEKRVINQQYLVSPPQSLTDTQVAGSLLKGLMAHTLLFRVYLAVRGKRILVHAAAGGVGQMLCSWAKHLGLEVIGTVGSDAKTNIAKAAGCDHVINYRSKDFVSEVADITKSVGVGVVYDGIGKDTLIKSLECLWPMGICINYGEASGRTEPIDLNHLVVNSLYITRPTLVLYKAKRAELVLSASEVFSNMEKKILRPTITTYSFSELAKAHSDLENRNSTGALVLKL